MKRSVQVAAMGVGVALVALIVAGCGSNNNDSSKSSSSTGSTQTTSSGGYGSYGKTTSSGSGSGAATVAVGTTSAGKILVGKDGRTLYLFMKDRGGKSRCTGACAAAWPPLTTSGTAKAGSGVTAGKLTTTQRGDGTEQVVYAGHPLYYYAPDTKSGQITGQNLDQFGAEWYVVSPAGTKVEGKGAKTGS